MCPFYCYKLIVINVQHLKINFDSQALWVLVYFVREGEDIAQKSIILFVGFKTLGTSMINYWLPVQPGSV